MSLKCAHSQTRKLESGARALFWGYDWKTQEIENFWQTVEWCSRPRKRRQRIRPILRKC